MIEHELGWYALPPEVRFDWCEQPPDGDLPWHQQAPVVEEPPDSYRLYVDEQEREWTRCETIFAAIRDCSRRARAESYRHLVHRSEPARLRRWRSAVRTQVGGRRANRSRARASSSGRSTSADDGDSEPEPVATPNAPRRRRL